jgi:hypothetical protein
MGKRLPKHISVEDARRLRWLVVHKPSANTMSEARAVMVDVRRWCKENLEEDYQVTGQGYSLVFIRCVGQSDAALVRMAWDNFAPHHR